MRSNMEQSFCFSLESSSDMVETFNRNGDTSAKRLKYDKYAAYARHLNDFVTFMKNNGVNLYTISVQNEPDYAHEWTWWTPQEILRFMRKRRLDQCPRHCA